MQRIRRQLVEVFNEGRVVQPTSDIDLLHRQGQLARSPLARFGRALADEIGCDFVMGDLKPMDVCIDKRDTKYDGNAGRITDFARCREEVDSIEQIYAVERILDPVRQSAFLTRAAAHGFYVRHIDNNFARPTKFGFRSFDIKLQVPISHGQMHIAEVQVIHRGMKDAYDQTHKILEEQRRIGNFNPNAKEISPELAAIFESVTRQRRVIHDDAAAKLGLGILERPAMEYVAPVKPSKFDMAA